MKKLIPVLSIAILIASCCKNSSAKVDIGKELSKESTLIKKSVYNQIRPIDRQRDTEF
jgi:hypothetical protein